MNRGVAGVLGGLVLIMLLTGGASAHSLPSSGDHFAYTESVILNGGQGNYTGYAEGTFVNGSISVTAVAANGTDAASYQYTTHYENNQGQSEQFPSSGAFTFSAVTFHYVVGTDNQTGYVDPYVWFYMNNSLPVGSGFTLLNTEFTVQSTDAAFQVPLTSTGWAKTLNADGSGSYQRNDVYGVFTAQYDWHEFFDPATGYIVGYVYTETDTDGAGDGFTWTDSLSVTSTSYPLTSIAAPPSPPPAAPASPVGALVVLAVFLLVIVVFVAIIVALFRRRRAPLPRHPIGGNVGFGPSYPPPPGLNFNVSGQPPVQQIVIKETVKTNCKYCGTLIDTTATVCPKCGAPRT